ncbi:MAG: hypothetical protein IKM97_04080 [Clostridia bacterium]|nr:hypothetical protein [Clostridia bacterium]
MNSFYFRKDKIDELFNIIKKELMVNRKNIEKAFELDYREWEYEVNFEQILSIIEIVKSKEYLPKFSKEIIVDGLGKICLLCNQNPYLVFNFIMSSIYTNNKVEVVLENKLLASNKVLIETVKKALNKYKADKDTVSYIELVNKYDIVFKQDNYDLIYYFGNKSSYLDFIKRIHIDTKFEEFGEIYLYSDSKEYKNEIIEIDKWAYLNEMKVNIYNSELEEVIKEINKLNAINKMSIIFSKDIKKIGKLIKELKSEKIYININPTNEYKIETNLNNLVYKKILKWNI